MESIQTLVMHICDYKEEKL